jgi:hypothetical protein
LQKAKKHTDSLWPLTRQNEDWMGFSTSFQACQYVIRMAFNRDRKPVARPYRADRVEIATPYASSKDRTVKPLFGG